MNYFKHWIKNWLIALHALLDLIAHLIHGLMPWVKIEHHQPKGCELMYCFGNYYNNRCTDLCIMTKECVINTNETMGSCNCKEKKYCNPMRQNIVTSNNFQPDQCPLKSFIKEGYNA